MREDIEKTNSRILKPVYRKITILELDKPCYSVSFGRASFRHKTGTDQNRKVFITMTTIRSECERAPVFCRDRHFCRNTTRTYSCSLRIKLYEKRLKVSSFELSNRAYSGGRRSIFKLALYSSVC